MPSPYNIQKDFDGFFSFITDHGLDYTIYLIDSSELWGTDISKGYTFFEFGFHCQNFGQQNTPRDVRIEITLIDFIQRFLTTNNDAVVYVASPQDGLDQHRLRLFDWWFARYNLASGFLKFKRKHANLVMLLSKQNPYKEDLISIFCSIEE